MRILVSAKMGAGTFSAKFLPLVELEEVESILIIRKSQGPDIPKIKYYLLPKYCQLPFLNLIMTPLIVLWFGVKYKPDLLLSYHIIPHAFFVGGVGRLLNIPFVVAQTGGLIEKKAKGTIFGPILKNMLNSSYKFNVPGMQSYQFWQSQGIIPSKVQVLHSTIDTERFKFGSSQERKFDFLFVGRLARVKRIHWILRALAELNEGDKSYTLGLVGDGPERSSLESEVERLGIESSVFFAGFQDDVNPWLLKAKYFVMSSSSEGLPVALMEAMATGLIPIVPKVNNIPSVVDHGENGYLYEPSQFKALVQSMKQASVHSDVYDSMALKAREAIETRYSFRIAKAKWKRLFEELENN